MALSMDEQRILAEIEQHLASGDPDLAARLSSFGRAGPGRRLRLPRAGVAGPIAALIAVTILSAVLYALIPFHMLPFRPAAHPVRAVTTAQSTPKPPPSPRTASPAAGPRHVRPR